MHTKLMELTTVVKQAAEGVVENYDPKPLYEFRVSVRRIRSILKQMDSHQSRRYRKIWGGFAAITNDARDWDVFLQTVTDLLSVSEYGDFETLNQRAVRHSRESVLELFHSQHWNRHLLEWNQVLDRALEQTALPNEDQATLEESLGNARTALRRALEIDDDHCWHKLRIRVKEVRYLAEAGVEHGDASHTNAVVIDSCKQLQTLLGDWHDTVVQLNLLEELPAAPVHSKLARLISERKEMFLTQARKLLQDHPLFYLEAGAKPGD